MVGGLFSGWGSMMNGWADTDGHPAAGWNGWEVERERKSLDLLSPRCRTHGVCV